MPPARHDEATCEIWADLLVSYNDTWSVAYRGLDPAALVDRHKIGAGIHRMENMRRWFFDGKGAEVLRKIAPDEFKATKATLFANLRAAEARLAQEDTAGAITYAEISLSAIHDLISALADQILAK